MAEDMKDYDVDGEDVMAGDDLDDDDMQEQGSLFWSLKVPVGEEAVEISEPSIPGYIIHITTASFGADVKKGSRTVVTCTNYLDDNFAPVCVLKEDKCETVKLDLLFGETAGFKLSGTKPSTVWLSGYLQPPMEDDTNPSFGGMDDLDDLNDMDEEEMKAELRRRGVNVDDLDEEEEEDNDGEGEETPQLVNDAEEPANKKRKLNGGKAQPSQKEEDKAVSKEKEKEKEKEDKASPKVTDMTPRSQEFTKDAKSPKEGGSPKSPKKKKQKKKMSNGIEYKEIKEGTGRKLKKGDTVYVYYIGQLSDNSIFDKTLSGRGFSFELGKGEVIKGWDIGLNGMKVGGKRKLWIPPKMGYGSEKMDKIPPNSQLIFTIEVKDVE